MFLVTLELVCLGGEQRSLRLELLQVEDVLQLPPCAQRSQTRTGVVGMRQPERGEIEQKS